MFRRLLSDSRGGITILAAAMMIAMMAFGGLAVDVGSICYESRRLQGIADAAALAAAGDLSAPMPAARAAIAASGWSRRMAPTVILGGYVPDPAIPAASRFTAGGAAPNAAQVAVAVDSPLFFGRVFGLRSVHLQRRATAARIDLTAFSLGSRLASLDGGVANQLLSGLTGSSVSLSLADYNALVGAKVDLLGYCKALRTELGLTGASFQQTLATATTLPHILNALAATLSASGNATAATAVGKLGAVAPATSMNLSQLADLGAVGKQDRAVGETAILVNAFAVLETMAELASGSRQVALDLSGAAPGLSSATATLVIGARRANSPWLALAGDGSVVVRTAQIRLYFDARALAPAGLRAFNIATVRLPVYVELAEAQARLSNQSCAGGVRNVGVDVQPAIGHAAIADVPTAELQNMSIAPAEQPATIVGIPALKVSGQARIDASSSTWQRVEFNDAEIRALAIKTVQSSGISSGVSQSLTEKLALTISAGGLPLNLSVLTGLVQPALTSTATLLDPALDASLGLLGIRLGQADVQINGVRCGLSSLVA